MSTSANASGDADSDAAYAVWPPPRSIVWITVGAILLRIGLLFGRGDYVAFDEGWYLLLGRNLWSGEGYSLSGLRHVALSPLFPILAGGLGRLLDPIWAGRLVAAAAAGLLTLPCWYLFRRLAGARVATVGTVFVAVLPSLAPFLVPYWIGWDLWVGAEPLLHLFLFAALALLLRAWEARSLRASVACGIAFALAYLARPEAVGVFGVAGILAIVLSFVERHRRGRVAAPTARAAAHSYGKWSSSRPMCLLACAVGFVAVSTPYWLYLHDALGRWAITGRWVQVMPSTRFQAGAQSASSNRIENMLWRGEDAAYIRSLYSLDASGMRLSNGYWGVRPPDDAASRESPSGETPSQASTSAVPPVTPSEASGAAASGPAGPDAGATPWVVRYGEALGVAVPWYVWIFAVAGLAARGQRRLELEALVGLPLVVTSLVIARAVAVDPRTQLLLAPWAAFYAARGVDLVGTVLASRLRGRIRGERAHRLLFAALVLALLGTSLTRLGFSLAVGSPHHTVAAQNAAVGEAIRGASPQRATVISFHPALALFADRDWRALPVEPMERIVRYARTQPTPHLVLSVFYPPVLRPLEEPHYLIVPVRPDLPDSGSWRIDVTEPAVVYAFGELMPRE